MSDHNSIQARECARFKLECGDDVEHITGTDWCDIDYRDYVPKRSIYATQPECFALETLINTWEGQLGYMQENLPSPMWPHDPYNRHKMTVNDIINYSHRYETNNNNIPGRNLPDKLRLFVSALESNPQQWETLLNDDSEDAIQNAIRTLFIQGGIYGADELTEDEILIYYPVLRFQYFIRIFLSNYELFYRGIIPHNDFVRLAPRLVDLLYNQIDLSNPAFMGNFDPVFQQLEQLNGQEYDPADYDDLQITNLVNYFTDQVAQVFRLDQRAKSLIRGRIFDWLPIILEVYHQEIALINVTLILQMAYHFRVDYNHLYVMVKTLLDEIIPEDWRTNPSFDFQDLITRVIEELVAHEMTSGSPETNDAIRQRMTEIFNEVSATF